MARRFAAGRWVPSATRRHSPMAPTRSSRPAAKAACSSSGRKRHGRWHGRTRIMARTGGRLNRQHPATRSAGRSEEHTSELQSLMRISYDVFCLKKKKHHIADENRPKLRSKEQIATTQDTTSIHYTDLSLKIKRENKSQEL